MTTVTLTPDLEAQIERSLALPPEEQLAEHYAGIIRDEATQTVQSIMRIGQTLAEAKEALGNQRWLEMVESDLDWKRSTAYALIKIGTKFSASDMLDALPPCRSTLELLAKLEPDELRKGIDCGAIHPGTTRSEASKFIYTKRVAREQAERLERSREGMARPPAPVPKASPAAVLRSITEDLAEIVGAIDALRCKLRREATRFGPPRKKIESGETYAPAEHVADLGDELDAASDQLGSTYDELAAECGLPTRAGA